ncbi:MAG: hypothetical protein U0794_13130 [Isosphaeraceae bacterium]
MPATEETYRSQNKLNIIFAVSSIAMTVAIVWMILADHWRPWKKVQREFHRLENVKLRAQEAAEKQALVESKKAELDALDAEIRKAEDFAYRRASEIRPVRYRAEVDRRPGGATRHGASLHEGRAR